MKLQTDRNRNPSNSGRPGRHPRYISVTPIYTESIAVSLGVPRVTHLSATLARLRSQRSSRYAIYGYPSMYTRPAA